VLRCSGCGVLHHPGCWVKHGGCATQPEHLSNPIAQAYSASRPPGAPAPHPGEGIRAVPRSFAPIPDATTQRPSTLEPRRGAGQERPGAAASAGAAGSSSAGQGVTASDPDGTPVVGSRRPVHHSAPEEEPAQPPGQVRRYAALNKAERYPPGTLPRVYGRHGILTYWYIPVAALVAVAVAFGIIWTVGQFTDGGTPAASQGDDGGSNAGDTSATPGAGGQPGGTVSTPTPGAGTPATPGKLTIGGVAVVTGTGDCLNVRVAPGRANDAVVCLADGQKVDVLDGPQSADSLQWWKVRTNLGDGWAAEDYLTPEP